MATADFRSTSACGVRRQRALRPPAGLAPRPIGRVAKNRPINNRRKNEHCKDLNTRYAIWKDIGETGDISSGDVRFIRR